MNVIKSKKNSKCSGYAFIIYKVETQAQKETLTQPIKSQKFYVKGRAIKVERYLTGAELEEHNLKNSKKRIFVSNLPYSLKDSDLKKIFSRFGEIESAYRVKVQSENRSTKYGYITFSDPS